MIVYQTNPQTGEYIGEYHADENPRDPANPVYPPECVTTAPPAPKTGFARVWDGAKWEQVVDKRGIDVWDAVGNKVSWFRLGGIPDGYALAPPLDKVKEQAKRAVIAFADSLTDKINAQYSESERASWPSKEREVDLVLSSAPESETPWITALAKATGRTRAELAQVIGQKATAYRTVAIAVELIRNQTSTAIDAATTPEAVAQVLEQARAVALEKAAQLGLV